MELRVFAEPQQGATYDDQLRLARAAEELGYGAFFRSDHYSYMGEGDPGPGPTDTWTTLAGLARETSTIRLGSMVTSATFRHPGVLAIQVAQVDAMSGGRVELGIGAGWYETEHRAYGIPFPPVRERFERLEEQLAIVTGLWDVAPGRTFGYRGTHYEVGDSPGLPKPVQRPHPPVILGGGGPRRTPALAAAYADEFNAPFFTPDRAEQQYARVRAACDATGRDPNALRYSTALILLAGKDDAAVRERIAAAGRTPEDDRGPTLTGTAGELVDTLGRWRELGASRVYCQLPFPADPGNLPMLEYVAAEVLPQLT